MASAEIVEESSKAIETGDLVLSSIKQNYFITDSGLETTLIFRKNRKLCDFAAFELLADSNRKESEEQHLQDIRLLEEYFQEHFQVAAKHNLGFIIETPTWRSSPHWGRKLGYTDQELDSINKRAAELFKHIKERAVSQQTTQTKVFLSGCIGPYGDGYALDNNLTAEEYREYHMSQVRALKCAGVDLVSAITINHAEEGIGIANASKDSKIPCVISFTVETNGKLPSDSTLADAIEKVEKATGGYPLYYMINCAHPNHFRNLFEEESQAMRLTKLQGIRVNASSLSHAELDNSTILHDGDPIALGKEVKELCILHPMLRVLGGCCGTDTRHIESIAANLPQP